MPCPTLWTRRLVLALALLVTSSSALQAVPQQWLKYVAPDRSFSFHYPQGWSVTQSDTIIQMTHAGTGEEMALFVWTMPRDGQARTLADEVLALLRQHAVNFHASGWRVDAGAAICDIGYTDEGKPQAGLLIAMAGPKQGVVWLFTAPRATFTRERAVQTLQAVGGSLVSGTGSRPPADTPAEAESAPPSASGAPPALTSAERARVDRSLRAYVFVLEFGLGGPFTLEQEQMILDEMWRGTMVATADGRAKLDGYPKLVKSVMALDRARLEELRQTIESGIRETLAETGDSDPAMRMIRQQLDRRGRPLIHGDPPLTEMAAQSYAELYAFAEAGARNPEARLSDVDPGEVRAIRRQLLEAWPKFSAGERDQVAAVPGLWMVLRKVIEFGSVSERQKTIGQLTTLVSRPAEAAAAPVGNAPADASVPNMLKHNSLMAIQQQTFNTYMWSRGFNYSAGGRMW